MLFQHFTSSENSVKFFPQKDYREVEPHGIKPMAPHMLLRAEPSEAYPTTLLRSFEGYPPRIHPRSKDTCLHAVVRYTCLREAASAKAGHAGVAFCVGG